MSTEQQSKPRKLRVRKRKTRTKKMDKTSKRGELMDDLEKVTNFPAATPKSQTSIPSGNESQGSVEQDVKVLNKAMEKLVMDIKELKSAVAEITTLKQENQRLHNRIDELAHAVGADQHLHEWQVDAAEDGDVIETPISNGELMRRMNDYTDRRAQYGMH